MTKHGMAHEDAVEVLEALALDALDAWERDAALTHIAMCSVCREELASLKATAENLAYAVNGQYMSNQGRDRVRKRLMARSGADRLRASGERAAISEPVEPPSFHIMVPNAHEHQALHARKWMNAPGTWVAMAAVLIAMVTGFMLWQTTNELYTLTAAYRVAVAEKGPAVLLDSMKTVLDEKDRMIASLTGPEVAVVSMTSNLPTAPSGMMFWDRAANAWTFVGHNLERPKAGRTYQLWLVTANQKISAGTFTPQNNGNAMVRATYAMPRGALSAVAVTEEPQEGSMQPTTTPFLAGQASTR